MNLELSDEETAALTQELHNIVENDRYPFSPRIRTPSADKARRRVNHSLVVDGDHGLNDRTERRGDRGPHCQFGRPCYVCRRSQLLVSKSGFKIPPGLLLL